jgi:hypothetical protein
MAIENAKTLNVRIKNKYDSYENWAASGLVLEAGEIAIAYTTVNVTVDNGTIEKHPALLMKVGDGEKTFANLPWLSAKAADVPAYAKKSEADFKAWVKTFISIDDVDTSAFALAADLNAEIDRAKKAEAQALTDAKAYTDAEIVEWVGDKTVGTQISEAITGLNLANTYEAKGEAAKVQTALDTYKTANDAAVLENKNAAAANTGAIAAIKDGTTIDSFADVETALAGKEASGAAAQALADAKSYADGLAGNYDAKGAAATAEANAKAYADGLAGNYDAAGAAAQALTDAKKYTDDEIAEWVGDKTVAAQIAALDLENTYEAKGDAAKAQAAAQTYADGLNTAMNTRVEALEAIDHEHANKAELDKIVEGDKAKWDAMEQNAKDYADDLDEAMDVRVKAIEDKFGGSEDGVGAQIAAAVAAEKAEREAADTALGNRVTAIEGDLNTETTGLKARMTTAEADIDALEGLVGDGNVSERIGAAVAAEAEIARAAEKANADAIKAISDDHLKAADKTELEGKITANANAIELLTNGVSAEEVDGVNDLIQYVKDHGTEVTGMKGDIKANADAIDAIEADYLKAADKTALQEQITANDGEIAALQTAVGTKAAQADLEALAGRVTTVEGDLNAETTGLKARMTTAEADIDALETKVGDETVAKQISDAIDALKIGDYAKAADLTAAIERIAKNEGDISGLGTRMGTAEGKIGTLETEVAKKANDADLAAIAKTGSTNDLVQGDMVLVFDCGTSAV